MKVTLAGYNIDISLIRKLEDEAVTPEVISAAYARISRSEKSVTELREEALSELPKARLSNQTIVFEMGHASVAEHAVFNFDVIGVSRLLTETLETLRFASFTEKSQRYVTFSKDYLIPEELEDPDFTELKDFYIEVMDALFAEYEASFLAIKEKLAKDFPDLPKRSLESMAKEDARYILPLSTKTQLGMTINARSLENLLRRLAENPLLEAAELYETLLSQAKKVCPSLVRYVEPEHFPGSLPIPKELMDFEILDDDYWGQMVDQTKNSDNMVLACLFYENSRSNWEKCLNYVNNLSENEREKLWRHFFQGIRPWSKMPRAFEMVDYQFELSMSESCWAQFKRHRVGTIIRQKIQGVRTCIMPEIISVIGRESQWTQLLGKNTELKKQLSTVSHELARYANLNGDTIQVLVRMNLRELYHLIRLRCDENAQWEIREISAEMAQSLRSVAPMSTAFLCGKSEFDALEP
ncbi:MAG: FAD-dependent thymidylate synthase [Candidatus Cloacimonetes bacterium]|nr:FAD-dependent thymidylate synthase [Candidatus Cloacimonadota bacterium]